MGNFYSESGEDCKINSCQILIPFPKRNRVIVGLRGQTRCTERKKTFSFGKRLGFPGKRQKERYVMKSNNQINVPEAREAMDKFKMQAASDLDVFFTS